MLDVVRNGEPLVNGMNLKAIQKLVRSIKEEPKNGILKFKVNSQWTGKAQSEHIVNTCKVGEKEVKRGFKTIIDNPAELMGKDSAPNPQEMLMSSLNACMIIGYVSAASIRGIQIDHIEIETEGGLDLRGFLGLDGDVPCHSKSMSYKIKVKGDGTEEEFQDIHKAVVKVCPNYNNLSSSIELIPKLEIIK